MLLEVMKRSLVCNIHVPTASPLSAHLGTALPAWTHMARVAAWILMAMLPGWTPTARVAAATPMARAAAWILMAKAAAWAPRGKSKRHDPMAMNQSIDGHESVN